MIDPTKPVFLKHMVRDTKTGNAYIPLSRPYEPGEVPFRLLTDANAYQDEAPVVEVPVVQQSKREIAPPLELSSSQTTTTKLEPQTPKAK